MFHLRGVKEKFKKIYFEICHCFAFLVEIEILKTKFTTEVKILETR